MTHRFWTLCITLALGLASGCGCQSRAIEGGEAGTTPGTGPATAGTAPGPGSAPATGPAGPSIPGGQDTGAPAIPAGDGAVDPTPASYTGAIEALAPPVEKEALTKLAADLDAKLAANSKDPVLWCTRAVVAAREALHSPPNAQGEPDLTEFTAAIERAAKHAGDGRWKYLVEHQRASLARLNRDPQAAIDHLNAAIKLQPAFVLGHVEYLQLMIGSGKVAEAEPKLRTLVKRWPQEWQGWYTLAQCQIRLKQLPAAKSSLDESLKLKPGMLVLQESMLRLESLIFRERKDEDSEAAVRARFDAIEALGPEHFTQQSNRDRHKQALDAERQRFEVSRAALLVVDFDLLEKRRRTRDNIIGRLENPNARRQMVRGIAAGIPGSEKAQDRVCFLLEVVRKDETDAVRVDALRGLHQNLGTRSPRPWKASEREAIAAMCQDDLAVLVTNLDPAKDRAVLLRVEETLGRLPASAISCGPELVARLEVLAGELDPLLHAILTLEAKPRKERTDAEQAEQKQRLRALAPIVEELEVIDNACKEIKGLGAPATPRWDVRKDIAEWAGRWSAWAAEITAMRTEKGWQRAAKCD